MGRIAQALHQLGFQGRRHAVLQLVSFDVGFVEIHAQKPHHQPLGETVAAGDAFALGLAPVGEADPLVAADVHEALLFHAAEHAGYRGHGGSEPFGGRQLAQRFGQPGQRRDLRVLPHLVDRQEVVLRYRRKAFGCVGRLGLSAGVSPGFAGSCHVCSQHNRRIVPRLYPKER